MTKTLRVSCSRCIAAGAGGTPRQPPMAAHAPVNWAKLLLM